MGENGSWRDDFTSRRIFGFVVAGLICLFLLPIAEADRETAESVTAQVAARDASKSIRFAVEEKATPGEPTPISLEYDGPDQFEDEARSGLQHETIELVEGAPNVVQARVRHDGENISVEYELKRPDADPVPTIGLKRVGGWEAVLPPLIAILIALFFRKLILALVSAVWLGATALSGWNPLFGLWNGATDYVWQSVADSFKIYIIAFTLSLVGMVQVITRMGGIAGVLERFRRFTETARSTRVTTALLGTAIFFDDYANTIVVGTSMRPITDRRKISREKLAYLVDSMSAPVAGVAIISTWVGYEVGLFDELSRQLALGRSGYDIFFGIIPLRFYCWFTIVFVLANAWFGRDYGPMLRAERRAAEGEPLRSGSSPLTSGAFAGSEPADDIPYRWWNAAIPIGCVIVGTLLGMFWSGWSSGEQTIPALFGSGFFDAWAVALGDLTSWDAWRDAFGNADSGKVLFWSSMLASTVTVGLAVGQRLLSLKEALLTFFKAVPAMWLAVVILVMAWSIQRVCSDLGTSIYLVGAVQDLLAPGMLPIVTFLLAAVVAFATGTSWGTMGILLPAMVPLAFYLTDGAEGGNLIILMLTFGAVLDGAIFGDHISPISDTTVMSSISASVDHIDHVRTQAPYAITTMSVAGLVGYVGVAFGLPEIAALIVGAVSCVLIVRFAGKRHA
jgi:Na+/H+ antiporter NhaC